MPKHREVPSLQSLALKSIGLLVAELAPHITADVLKHYEPKKIPQNLQKHIDWLNKLLVSHVPYYLYDAMAKEVLTSIKHLIEQTKKIYYPHVSISNFIIEMNVVVSLTEIVLNPSLKSIDFSDWPKIMRYVLYKKLVNMTGLENLNLGSCIGSWATSECDKCILDGIINMKNLRSLCICFDCSDIVVQTVSENCPLLQTLDVTSSRSVTDRSVPYLLKCSQLRELHLNRTSVTINGLAELIVGLPKLQDIGRCDEFGGVIKKLHQNYSDCGPFALRKVQSRDLSTENLRLFVDMFPKVEYISLFHEEQVTDLTVLISLDNLKDLKLLSCAFYGDYLKQLLEVKGNILTSLHLEHAEEMDLNVLIDISQYCPRLKSLVFYNCDFTDNSALQSRRLSVQPFQSLEKIFWVVDSSIGHLEFILRHAVNIRFIHLGTSTGISHSCIVNILSVNPMKYLEELRVLYSQDMNMRTVELLLASCTNLKVLSELESWLGISTEELQSFKKHIISSNFDLDIRPTLSYSS